MDTVRLDGFSYLVCDAALRVGDPFMGGAVVSVEPWEDCVRVVVDWVGYSI